MMSCKQVSYLLSQQLDRKLSTSERVSLRFHLMMCSGCTNCRNNMLFLRKASKYIGNNKAPE